MSKLNYLIKPFVLIFLFFLILVNLSSFHQNQLIHSFSKGDKYYRTLQKWYFYAQKEDWEKAKLIENKLNYADIVLFKEKNQLYFLKNNLKKLEIRENKSSGDWIKLAQVYAKLGKKQEAFIAITKAKETDIIRSDIEELYFKLLSDFR
jgi:hypothetical protein